MNLIAKSGRIGRGLFLAVMIVALSAVGACGGGDEGLPEDTVLTLNWTGLSSDTFGAIIYTRLQAVSDGYKIGPYETNIREDGSAIVGIDEAYDTSEAWIVSYWIDVDNDQLLEEDADDILRQHTLSLGATSATLNHATDAAPAGLGAFSGFSNYDPRP